MDRPYQEDSMIRFTPYRSGSDANLNTVDDGP